MAITYDIMTKDISRASQVMIFLQNTDYPDEVRFFAIDSQLIGFEVGNTTEQDLAALIAERYGLETTQDAWDAAPVAKAGLTAVWLAYKQIQNIDIVENFQFDGAAVGDVITHVDYLTRLTVLQNRLILVLFDQLFKVF